MPGKMIDVTGQKFGRLTVKEMTSKYMTDGLDANGHDIMRRKTYCVCDCDCGKKNVLISSYALRHGKTRSCGCLRNELSTERVKKAIPKWRQEYDARVRRWSTPEYIAAARLNLLPTKQETR